MLKFCEHFNVDYENAVKNREMFDDYDLTGLKKEIPELNITSVNIKKGRAVLAENNKSTYWLLWLNIGEPIIIGFYDDKIKTTLHSSTNPELFEIPSDYIPRNFIEVLEEKIIK